MPIRRSDLEKKRPLTPEQKLERIKKLLVEQEPDMLFLDYEIAERCKLDEMEVATDLLPKLIRVGIIEKVKYEEKEYYGMRK